MEGLKIIDIKIDASKFIKELKTKPSKVKKTVQEDSYERLEIVNEHTEAKVPYETGKLRASLMRANTVAVHGDIVEQELQYSAFNERTGYDYAFIQETNPSYTHRVGGMRFMEKGINESRPYILKSLEGSVQRAFKEV